MVHYNAKALAVLEGRMNDDSNPISDCGLTDAQHDAVIRPRPSRTSEKTRKDRCIHQKLVEGT